ncbi:barstar family protein [Planotetraspora sp. A-T 1434]|uniref:barstar family protein n=1 Tax=Planotetraspora sp. A-T 1434 TaxID=2979219 RepID=UPI0021C0E28D|nr:barstar family protein [Planotetraspora sp. A-T 1434]MCT9929471.1 barstar family protein [Planotetraspora sp. A-T 1434]
MEERVWSLAGSRPLAGDVTVRLLDGHRCRTKESLLTHWAGRLSFPGYFGRNWDAFEECLIDFLHDSVPSGDGLVLRVENAGDLLIEGDESELRVLADILRTVVADFREPGSPDVAVELADDEARLAALRRRLERKGSGGISG